MQSLHLPATGSRPLDRFPAAYNNNFCRRIVDSYGGLLSSAAIFCLWSVSLIFLLYLDLGKVAIGWVGLAFLGRAILHTGLFTIAHDAAHGTVFPQKRRLNHAIGAAAIAIYAFLPYQKFVKNHSLHHHQPAREGDPDFHDGRHDSAIAWYIGFMKTYLTGKQILVLLVWFTVLFHGIRLGLHISGMNLILFWILPILVSSLQLFIFGTYLPHRQPQAGYTNRHRAESVRLPVLWSFLACYHFGYHWEHHEYPHLPWYKLPSALGSQH